jgi:hypothetical protein
MTNPWKVLASHLQRRTEYGREGCNRWTPWHFQLLNIIGEMAVILPLPSRSTTPEKSYPVAPVRGGTSARPFRSNGSQ